MAPDNVLMVAMRQWANWLAWVLQGIFGFFVGAGMGFIAIFRQYYGYWLDSNLILPFVIGAALIGAGLGSRYGDRFWLGDNSRELVPDEPEQSIPSELLSWCLFGAGLATCIVTLLKQLRFL
jgi:hypothetical protein